MRFPSSIPPKRCSFRSYAQFRIRGAILDSLRTLDWSPRELRRKGRAVEEAIRVLTARAGHAPEEVRWPRRWTRPEEYSSCSAPEGPGIGPCTWSARDSARGAAYSGRPDDDPLSNAFAASSEERLADAIAHLPAGTAGHDALLLRKMTMRELVWRWAVVESRVSQVTHRL